MKENGKAKNVTRKVKCADGIGVREKDLNALIEVLAKLSAKGEERANRFVRDGRKNQAKREEWANGVCFQLEEAIVRLLLRRHRDKMGELAQSLLRNMNQLEREFKMIEEEGYRPGLIRSLIDLRDDRPYMEEIVTTGAQFAPVGEVRKAQTVADVYGTVGGD